MIIPLKSGVSWRGSIPGCLALQAYDIGAGVTLYTNEVVHFAWGANWTEQEANDYMDHTGGDCVELQIVHEAGGPPEGRRNFAPLLLERHFAKLQPVLYD